jgi:DNA-binding transcriptional ArsR family regulator
MGSLAEARPRAKYLADVLKALAHPARLRIVAALCEGEESVIGLAGRLGMPQAIVSQQLRILRMSGLVAAEREAGFARYALAQPRLRQLVSCLEGCHTETAGAPSARKEGARR